MRAHLRRTSSLGAQLHRLVFDYWQIPNAAAIAFLHVCNKSDAAHATTFRHHLAVAAMAVATGEGMRLVDLESLFARVLTPTFVMRMVEELQERRELPAGHAHVIEEAILACVDREGRWRPVESGVPHRERS